MEEDCSKQCSICGTARKEGDGDICKRCWDGGNRKCPKQDCGATVEVGDSFCGDCGNDLYFQSVVSQDDKYECKCGNRVDRKKKFCKFCRATSKFLYLV